MDKLGAFFSAPSAATLDVLTKDELIKVTEHYAFELEIPKAIKRDKLLRLVREQLAGREICSFDPVPELLNTAASSTPQGSDAADRPSGLTFEQQMKIMEMQMEREKFSQRQWERETEEREKERVEREKDRELQYIKIKLEEERLRLGSEGRAPGGNPGVSFSSSKLSSMVKLLPKFNERDPDVFFTLFEILADDHGWKDSERVLLLQSVMSAKAQEAYIAMDGSERKDYPAVKQAILKAYELVPEAYRQRFRNCRKNDRQTHLEVVRELAALFTRWRTAEGVDAFAGLCELVVLEQFKNIIPERITTHINEHDVKTAAEAAVLADKYILTHKFSVRAQNSNEDFRPRRFSSFRPDSSVPRHDFNQRKYESNDKQNVDSKEVCHYCLRKGHWKNECPVLQEKRRSKVQPKGAGCAARIVRPERQESVDEPSVTVVGGNASRRCSVSESTDTVREELSLEEPQADASDSYRPFVTQGYVSLIGSDQKVPLRILRDTGASESFVLQSILPFSQKSDTGTCVLIRGIGMHTISVPLHRIALESELVRGEVVLAVRPSLPVEGVEMILGNNYAGGRVWPEMPPPPVVNTKSFLHVESDPCFAEFPEVFTSCAVTRAMSRARGGDGESEELDLACLKVPVLPPTLSREEVVAAVKEDEELAGLLAGAGSAGEMRSAANGYFVVNDLLVRKWSQSNGEVGDPVIQIVMPKQFRGIVLGTAHGGVAGHFGVRKTHQRLLKHFCWPGVKRDVAKVVKTCHICQLTGKPNQSIRPAPLCPIPAAEKPFEHLIIDCVGPLPSSKSGCAYLLTVMCQATRYPAAYPLRSITTRSVVKALSQFISIFGIPKVIQSDRGTNFTSNMFRNILKQLHVKQRLSSAYHPQSQGALERFHCTLKSLLRAYCLELGRDWEEGVPWLLLAAREVGQESTGFSPNELVFAHQVRGPLSLLKDGLEESKPPVKVVDYVNGFRRRLMLAWKMASENLTKSQRGMKRLFDRRAVKRAFSPGDQVLALLPMPGSPFCAKFTGPYTVVRQVSEYDYLLATPDRKRSTQLCHINLLKPYYSPGPSSGPNAVAVVDSVASGQPRVAAEADGVAPDDSVLQPRLKNSEVLANLDSLVGHLSSEHRAELKALILSYPVLFSDTLTGTDLIEHDIDVNDASPIRQRFYRVGPDKRKILDGEVQYLLDHGLAEPSYSSWASPCLLVAKPDNTFRFCTDYRKLNKVTKPDSFPLPRVEDCIDQVGAARFVSKFDLLKGYYQVKLTPRAQEVSAFITPSGLFSYRVMSFGLRNAPATFQRLMNRVISGLEGCAVYLDDAVVVSNTWLEHLARIRAFLERLVAAKLTVNLAKCEFAHATVVYLGKVVGQGKVRPVRAKVLAIDRFPPPTTKKELQRFLGMVGYYRSFCSNFSTVVCPLTNLLKGGARYVWSVGCQQAFDNVKSLLSTAPVLAAPQLDKPFQLQVDASQVGAGAVLLQTGESGIDRPVCYFSRKFNKHQINYSTIEKEALALVWALVHFDVYLGGGVQPLVVYSDHNPLTYLHTLHNPNQRLMRWALYLQPYHLEVRHIRGVDNVIADALSRSWVTG